MTNSLVQQCFQRSLQGTRIAHDQDHGYSTCCIFRYSPPSVWTESLLALALVLWLLMESAAP
jgi:hypothetical protein